MLHPALVHPVERFARGDAADPRIGDVMKMVSSVDELGPGDLVLLGVCNEVGVLANRGRPGASEGPLAFRKALGALVAATLRGRRILDAGDVPATVDYPVFFEATQAVVAACVARGALPIVVGGGNDCSYGSYLGLAETRPGRVAVLNVDAHLDVRPVHGPSSGNPFFRMLEHALEGEDLAEIALVPFVNAAPHVAYARKKGVRLHFLTPGDEARTLSEARFALGVFAARSRRVLATVDLDAIGVAWAPGVSAPNPWGLDASTAIALAGELGRSSAVACFELMELSPPYDRDGQTARLAAFMVAAFVAGLDERVTARC